MELLLHHFPLPQKNYCWWSQSSDTEISDHAGVEYEKSKEEIKSLTHAVGLRNQT